jgi:exopolysaccharide production protein ExoQ
MTMHSTANTIPNAATLFGLRPARLIGFIVGLFMPLVAAWCYPTYFFWMQSPFLEWTRLQELPFVLCEMAVIGWALICGFELRQITQVVPRDCMIALAIFFVGLWGSTLLVSQVPVTSLTISLSFVVHLLFACSIYFLVQDAGTELIDDLGFGLICGLVALGAVTAWKFLLPPNPSSVFMGTIAWEAALPGFISVRHFGSWTGAIAAIFAAIILCRKNDKATSWHDLAYLISIGMTIWSGTRAAILAIGLTCLIMVISRQKLPSLHTIGQLLILTGIAATLAYLLIPYGSAEFMLLSPSDGYGNADEVMSGRETLWSLTYAEWLKAPLFGWGSGATFWQVPYPNWHHTQPHNFVLQFLVSWGFVGASGAIWLLGRAVVAAHRGAMARSHIWPLLAGLYSLLIMACLEGMLHYPRFIMLIMVLFAMIFAVVARPESIRLPEAPLPS